MDFAPKTKGYLRYGQAAIYLNQIASMGFLSDGWIRQSMLPNMGIFQMDFGQLVQRFDLPVNVQSRTKQQEFVQPLNAKSACAQRPPLQLCSTLIADALKHPCCNCARPS